MSLECISWFVWAGLSIFGSLLSSLDGGFWALAIVLVAIVVVCLYGTGLVTERWRENK